MSESTISRSAKKEKYKSLLAQIKALVEGEKDFMANISNIIAALKCEMNFLWAGVYFVKGNQLVLGPFQGPVACTRIAFGKGVCGTAWKEKKTVMVEDVQNFPEHISCCSESKSEIVVPCFKGKKVFAVLDIDSNKISGFDEMDKKQIEQIVRIIEQLT